MPSPERPDVLELDPSSPDVVRAWRDLARRCPGASVFQHPDWLLPWRAHLGRDLAPRVLGVASSGALIGLAPLVIDGRAPIERARPPARRWREARGADPTLAPEPFAETRREAHIGGGTLALMGGDESDYLGVLAIPQAREAVASALFAHLARMEWARCELARLELGSPLLACACPPSLSITIAARDQDVCPYLPIPRGARALADVLPRGFAKRVAQSRRVAGRAGRLERVWAREADVDARLETLFALHGAWWRARGEEGVLASPAVRAFLRESTAALARERALRLLELRLEGAPIASVLAFASPGRVLHYIGGVAPEAAKLSPGRLAIAALIERAIEEGARELDFLRGVEPYKYDFGARDRWTRTLTLERR